MRTSMLESFRNPMSLYGPYYVHQNYGGSLPVW